MLKKPKVLITLIENGMGHIVSAKSIQDSLIKKYANDFEITEQMVMDYKQDKDLARMQKFLVQNVKATNKHNWYGFFIFGIIKILGGAKFNTFLNHTFFGSAFKKMVQELDESDADIIVSTHYWLTSAALYLKKHKKPNLVVINYNSENNVHIWWDKHADVFITNNIHATKEAIEKRKFQPESVVQVNFVVRDEVLRFNGSKEECRKELGLSPKEFVVTIADGAYSSGKLEKTVEALLKSKLNLTIIALCAKNKLLLEKYNNNKNKVSKNIKLIPMGYIPEAYKIYKASDLVITKSGPNTLLDCVYMRTPFIVSYYAHQIEKSAAQIFAKEYGCGVIEKNLNNIVELVKSFQNNPQLLKPYIENSILHFKEGIKGADQIADIIYKKAQEAGLLKNE